MQQVLIHRSLLKKVDLVSLKSETDKLGIDKFETTPVDLRKLSDLGNNEVVKKTLHADLVKKLMLFRLTVNSRKFYCKIKKSKFSN